MRLDKFLKVSRLVKRRTVASEICENARVFVNDNPAKPAKQLKVGDEIKIEYFNKIQHVKILKIPVGNVSINEAPNLYEVLND